MLADAYVQAYIDERREQSLDELLAASIEVQNKITELETEIEALSAGDPLCDALLAQQAAFGQTLDQLQVDSALKTGGASVVKSAELPTNPVGPTPTRTAALTGIVGLPLGLVAAVAADYFDDSVRNEEDLERLAPLSVLAVVPTAPPIDNWPVSVSAPGDYAVETHRGLRTNIQFLGLDRQIKVIQFTSAMPGEGKTTTATNLAVVLVQAGKPVVIVDGDLRRPSIHEVFATPRSPGLIDLLIGEAHGLVIRPLEIGDGDSTGKHTKPAEQRPVAPSGAELPGGLV